MRVFPVTDVVGRLASPAAVPRFDSKWLLIGVPVALVVWLALVPLVVAAPVPKALKEKVPDLNGTWEVTEYHSGGNKLTTPKMNWVIDGEKLTIDRLNIKGVPIKSAVTYSLKKPEGGGPNDIDYVLRALNASVTTDRTMAISSATVARCGSSSDNSAPQRPCRANLKRGPSSFELGLMNAAR